MLEVRVEQVASPEELYSSPTMKFVAEFVGLTNRLTATVAGGTARVAGAGLPTLEGSLREGAGVALVRPESVQVRTASGSGSGDGNGRVVTSSFLGTISRLRIDMDDDTTMMAQVPRTSLAAISPGDRVDVLIDPVPVLVVAD